MGAAARKAIQASDETSLSSVLTSIKMTFASNLRRLLRDRDIRSKDLAAQLGVSPSIVTHWRNADKFPAPENLDRICEILKVPYVELFREAGPSSPTNKMDAESALEVLARLLDYKIVKRSDD